MDLQFNQLQAVSVCMHLPGVNSDFKAETTRPVYLGVVPQKGSGWY